MKLSTAILHSMFSEDDCKDDKCVKGVKDSTTLLAYEHNNSNCENTSIEFDKPEKFYARNFLSQ